MKRENIRWFLTSVLILLPTLLFLVLDGWFADMAGNRWESEAAADAALSAFRMLRLVPLFLLLMHGICLAVTKWDNRKRGQSPKVMRLVFWIMPILSLYCGAMTVAFVLNLPLRPSSFAGILMGLLMLLIGNYLPKCTPNRTIGIRLPWTMQNAENWQKTHRFGGKVFVAVGILSLLGVFFPESIFVGLFAVSLLGAVLATTLYSYGYARKQRREGTFSKESTPIKPLNKRTKVWTACLISVVLIACFILCFTGEIICRIDANSVSVEATYDRGLTIALEDIDTIVYRADGVTGERVNGFGSPRLLLGWFSNEEFGHYRRYTYTDVTPCLVLTLKQGGIVVIGAASESETEQLYQALTEAMTAKNDIAT